MTTGTIIGLCLALFIVAVLAWVWWIGDEDGG